MSTPLPVQPNRKNDGTGTQSPADQPWLCPETPFPRPLRCWKRSRCGVKQHNRQLCSHCCCRKLRGRCQQGEGTWIQLEKAAPAPAHHPKLWVWGKPACAVPKQGDGLRYFPPSFKVGGIFPPSPAFFWFLGTSEMLECDGTGAAGGEGQLRESKSINTRFSR